MKIDHIDHLYHGKVSSPEKTAKGDGFKKIFDQRLAEIDQTTSQIPDGSNAEILKRSERVLDLLDEYASGLNNPEKTLKDIEPLVASIKEEADSIERESQEKLQHDEELERLVKELSVTANVAMFKFHRGDYI
jgi:DNA repair ATPase RecN